MNRLKPEQLTFLETLRSGDSSSRGCYSALQGHSWALFWVSFPLLSSFRIQPMFISMVILWSYILWKYWKHIQLIHEVRGEFLLLRTYKNQVHRQIFLDLLPWSLLDHILTVLSKSWIRAKPKNICLSHPVWMIPTQTQTEQADFGMKWKIFLLTSQLWKNMSVTTWTE